MQRSMLTSCCITIRRLTVALPHQFSQQPGSERTQKDVSKLMGASTLIVRHTFSQDRSDICIVHPTMGIGT
jgi:hypothetical protein